MKRTELLSARKNEKGFTLVELAIVMIIIGLLIGGVLKGQELINNAQIAAAVTEIKGFDSAIGAFRDAYAGFPGDIINPVVRLPGCAAAPCNLPGDGNGRIGANGALTLTAVGTENLAAWAQLAASGMMTSIDGTNVVAYGAALPQSAFGAGGYQISYNDGTAFAGIVMSSSHVLQLGALVQLANAAGSEVLTSTQAARIDRKMDDGVPNTGGVVDVGAVGTCQVGAGAAAQAYNEAVNPSTCALVISMSN